MKRSLMLGMIGLTLVGSLAGNAFAGSPEGQRQKLCINTGADEGDLFDSQYCITWVDPTIAPAQ